MKQIFEFLIALENAERMNFPLHLGQPTGLWIKIRASPADEVLELLRKCSEQWSAQGNLGSFAVGGSTCRRLYTPAEMNAAELFRMVPSGLDSEAASDQSAYDLSGCCQHCGAGRRQLSDLLIDCTQLPKTRTIVHTIGKEWIFRMELAQAILEQDFTGLSFRPVIHCRDLSDMPIDLQKYPTGRKILEVAKSRGTLPPACLELEYPDLWPALMAEHHAVIRRVESRSRLSGKASQHWLQLEVTSTPAHTCEPTEFGTSYFDREEAVLRRRCPLGHTSGAALLSEVWIRRRHWDAADISCTSNLYGFGAGYFVPEPAMLVSPRLYRFLTERKAKGATFEVAHLTD